MPKTKAFSFPAALHGKAEKSDLHVSQLVLNDATSGALLTEQFRVNRTGFVLLAGLGLQARMNALFQDIDRDPHEPLDANLGDEKKQEQLARERAVILAACEKAGFGCPSDLMPTRKGWRIMWRLAKPILIENEGDFESVKGHILGVIERLQEAGLDGQDGLIADPACKEPNRLYRMPNVLRDGVKTWTEDYMTLSEGVEEFGDHTLLDLESVEPPPSFTVKTETESVPDDEAIAAFDALGERMKSRVRAWAYAHVRSMRGELKSARDGTGRNDLYLGLQKDTWGYVNAGILPPEELDTNHETYISCDGVDERNAESTRRSARNSMAGEGFDVQILFDRWAKEGDADDDGPAERLTNSEAPRASEFPVGILPGVIRDFAEAVARIVQVFPEMVAMQILPLIAACLMKTVKIRITPGWAENLNLWVAILADTGERKSSVYGEVHCPLIASQEEQLDQWKAKVGAIGLEIGLVDKLIGQVKKNAAEASKGMETHAPNRAEDAKKLAELNDQRLKLEREIPPSPNILIQDTTVEAMVDRLVATGGRGYVGDTEGGLFAYLSGARYGNGAPPATDIFLKGKSSEPFISDRKSNEGADKCRRISAVDLVIMTCVQRAAFAKVLEKPFLREIGFLGRWLICQPGSYVGERRLSKESIPGHVRSEYDRLIDGLLRRFQSPEALAADPDELTFTPEAQEFFEHEVYDVFESQMRVGGALRNAKDVGNRAPAHIVQIAGVFHMAEHGPAGVTLPIELETLRNALTLGKWLLDQTLDAIDSGPEEGTGSVAEWAKARIVADPEASLCVDAAFADFSAWYSGLSNPSVALVKHKGGAFSKEVKKVLGIKGRLPKPDATRQLMGFRLVASGEGSAS